jgi:hypothetical protein
LLLLACKDRSLRLIQLDGWELKAQLYYERVEQVELRATESGSVSAPMQQALYTQPARILKDLISQQESA